MEVPSSMSSAYLDLSTLFPGGIEHVTHQAGGLLSAATPRNGPFDLIGGDSEAIERTMAVRSDSSHLEWQLVSCVLLPSKRFPDSVPLQAIVLVFCDLRDKGTELVITGRAAAATDSLSGHNQTERVGKNSTVSSALLSTTRILLINIDEVKVSALKLVAFLVKS